MQKVINSGKKKVYQFHRFLSNRDINTVERRLLLVLVLCPTNKNKGGKCGDKDIPRVASTVTWALNLLAIVNGIAMCKR